MKICYIANVGSIHTQRWVNYFADKGHEVHLISPRPFGDNNIEDVKLHVFKKVRPQIRIVSGAINLLLYAIQIRRLLKRARPDILHAHYISEHAFLGALSGFHPFILSAWGSDVLRARNGIFYSSSLKYSLKKADRVTTTSIHMRDYLVRQHGLNAGKVVRIPWGIDLTTFKRGYEAEAKALRATLGIPEDAPIIISGRSLAPQYNVETIMKAIPSVIGRFPGAVFVFLRGSGTPSYEDAIRAELGALGVARNAAFVPQLLSPKEMAVYYNASDISISVPSVGQFGATILEGMACGAIPIATDIEVHKEYLEDGHNSFLVTPCDSEELAQKIVHCLGHPELKEQFYAINKELVEEKENWSKNAVAMEELYRSLLT